MKHRYLYGAIVAAAALAASCTADEGTQPGSDAAPAVTIYTYTPELPYNADNDVALRFAANRQTENAYCLIEPTDDMAARMESLGEEGYMDYVVSNGTKLELDGQTRVADAVVTDLMGSCTISAVGVGAGRKHLTQTEFVGLEWATVAAGTYYFTVLGSMGVEPRPTELQRCTNSEGLYRFRNLFKEGYHMKITMLDIMGEDADGTYQFFRVPAGQNTGYTYGDYGPIYVRDIGYWQNNDAFVTSGGYESGMYEDGYCFVCVQYYVSAGSLGYNYDEFVPDN